MEEGGRKRTGGSNQTREKRRATVAGPMCLVVKKTEQHKVTKVNRINQLHKWRGFAGEKKSKPGGKVEGKIPRGKVDEKKKQADFHYYGVDPLTRDVQDSEGVTLNRFEKREREYCDPEKKKKNTT